MKTFKGLIVPVYASDFRERHYFTESKAKLQDTYCESVFHGSTGCHSLLCEHCLFSTMNFPIFIDWFRINQREEKLKRILT